MEKKSTRTSRGGGEGVKDGGVEWITEMGSPVVERTLPGGSSLDGKAQKADHGEAGVLDLRELQSGFLLGVGRKAKGIKEFATWVQPLLGVQFGVPLELDVADHEHLNPYQCGHGEGERLAEIRGAVL